MATMQWRGTAGQEPGRKGSWSGRREGRKWDSHGNGNRKKFEKKSPHFIIFFNWNGANWRKKLQKKRLWEARVRGTGRGTGSRSFRSLCPPPQCRAWKKCAVQSSVWVWNQVYMHTLCHPIHKEKTYCIQMQYEITKSYRYKTCTGVSFQISSPPCTLEYR